MKIDSGWFIKTTFVNASIYWEPIDLALKEDHVEFIGVIIRRENDNWKITNGPFILFWSSSLKRFVNSPTHFIPYPLSQFPGFIYNG